MAQGNWIWYEYMAKDPAGAKAFYEAVLGWSITLGDGATNDGPNDGPPDYGFIANADGGYTGGVLTITADMAQQGARPCWLGYIQVDDCAAAVDAVVARGGAVVMPVTQLPVGTIALVSDPWGAHAYLMTPQTQEGMPPSTAFAPRMVGRCGWNELLSTDPAAAVKFYTELFGWSLPGSMDMGPLGTYQFVGQGDEAHGAIMTTMPQAPRPHWNHYFRVADIDAAKAAVESHGGTVLNGPMQVPGDDWVILGRDPQDGFFCLVGGKAA